MTIIEHQWHNITRAVITEGIRGVVIVDLATKQENDAICNKGEAFLQNLVVNTKYREEGVGKRLINAALKWAKQNGARKIYLEHNDSDTPMWVAEWYERLGWKQDGFRTSEEFTEILYSKVLVDVTCEKPIDQNAEPFKPFEQVLARDYDTQRWKATFFSHYTGESAFPFACTDKHHKLCIRFAGNENRIGTTD